MIGCAGVDGRNQHADLPATFVLLGVLFDASLSLRLKGVSLADERVHSFTLRDFGDVAERNMENCRMRGSKFVACSNHTYFPARHLFDQIIPIYLVTT
jgi:hypothetical protein